MESANFIGQTLDHKYKIERELGRGGMGTVYLATHVGTERPVALKIIAPQFMQRRELSSVRREALAAGRLRHPTCQRYRLRLCRTPDDELSPILSWNIWTRTLGRILERKQIPLSGTIDILDRFVQNVQDAHEQGIIHRDLKPTPLARPTTRRLTP